jgi:hypothetical protein
VIRLARHDYLAPRERGEVGEAHCAEPGEGHSRCFGEEFAPMIAPHPASLRSATLSPPCGARDWGTVPDPARSPLSQGSRKGGAN